MVIALKVQEPESPYKVDRDTGEILEFPLKVDVNKKKRDSLKSLIPLGHNSHIRENGSLKRVINRGSWMQIDQSLSAKLIESGWLTRPAKVYEALKLLLRYGNKVYCEQPELSEMTGIGANHLGDAIKELKNENLIKQIRSYEYMLNPEYCFKGSRSALGQALSEYYRIKGI